MRKEYEIYKGLQKPLIYKGFKGKYVYWALGSVLCGVIFGGILSVTVNIISGAVSMAVIMSLGIVYTSQRQRNGLHNKSNERGIFVHKANLNGYVKKKNI